MRKDKKSLLLEGILLVVIIGALVAALGILLPNWSSAYRDRQSREAVQMLRSPTMSTEEEQEETVCLEVSQATEPPTQDETISEALLELYRENADFAGWLKGGGKIDYPVMLRDDSYYLYKDFFGNSDSNGTLFLNGANSIRPRDDVLLIHGHAMNSGAMFGRLTDYSRSDYVKEHPIFSFQTIYDPSPVYYTPFAAFHASMMPEQADYYPLVQLSFPREENGERPEYQTYLEDIQKRNILTLPIDVSIDDELLVLVTCSYYNDDGRFMLFCRRLRSNESPKTVEQVYANQKE